MFGLLEPGHDYASEPAFCQAREPTQFSVGERKSFGEGAQIRSGPHDIFFSSMDFEPQEVAEGIHPEENARREAVLRP